MYPAERTELWISGLSSTTTVTGLKEHLANVGANFLTARIGRIPGSTPQHVAAVAMATAEEVDRAIEMTQNRIMHGRTWHVSKPTPSQLRFFDFEPPVTDPSRYLWVDGLSSATRNKHLQDAFFPAGTQIGPRDNAIRTRVMLAKTRRQGEFVGLVVMHDVEEARLAIPKIANSVCDGKKISAIFAPVNKLDFYRD